jgi:Flp pilus assembly protein TadG
MSHSTRSCFPSSVQQRGAVAVEFAVISALFLLTLLVGIIELGRAFFYMNATAEATRWGARVAVVCDVSEATRDFVRQGMREYVNVLNDGDIDITYVSEAGTYRSVTVSVAGATFDTVIPFVPLTWTIPLFATTLPTESLDSAGGANPVCH